MERHYIRSLQTIINGNNIDIPYLLEKYYPNTQTRLKSPYLTGSNASHTVASHRISPVDDVGPMSDIV